MTGGWRRLASALVLFTATVVGWPWSTPAGAQAPATEGSGVTWRQVSAGTFHTCAVATTGRLYCWGYDARGALGVGGGATWRSTPVEVAGAPQDWASVSAHGWSGSSHTCAITTSGRLFCWGSDGHGQLGDDDALVDQSVPVEVAGQSTRWATVSLGDRHTCATRTSGRLYCWGDDWSGQVGDGGVPAASRPVPVEVFGRTADWTSVSAGSSHTCGRKTSGRLYCWGDNGERQLGDGTERGRRFPREVAGGTADWSSVSAGHRHTCARKLNRRMFCWGDNFTGQLGNGRTSASGSAVPVEVGAHTADWAGVTAGAWHTCARKTNRQLFCWGRDTVGALGDDAVFASRTTPVQVAGRHTDWASIDAGYFHACGIRAAERLFCWGGQSFGDLGHGLFDTDQPVPVEVSPP